MDFNDLTAEQREKARSCSSPEELLALAKQEGIELSNEQIEAISGGAVFGAGECKKYGEDTWG